MSVGKWLLMLQRNYCYTLPLDQLSESDVLVLLFYPDLSRSNSLPIIVLT